MILLGEPAPNANNAGGNDARLDPPATSVARADRMMLSVRDIPIRS
jgi:hypothetical protein